MDELRPCLLLLLLLPLLLGLLILEDHEVDQGGGDAQEGEDNGGNLDHAAAAPGSPHPGSFRRSRLRLLTAGHFLVWLPIGGGRKHLQKDKDKLLLFQILIVNPHDGRINCSIPAPLLCCR